MGIKAAEGAPTESSIHISLMVHSEVMRGYPQFRIFSNIRQSCKQFISKFSFHGTFLKFHSQLIEKNFWHETILSRWEIFTSYSSDHELLTRVSGCKYYGIH